MPKYTANSPEIVKLVKYLTKWSDAYHNTSKPIVSDEKYNKYLALLEKYVPTHPFLKKVGAPIKKGKKVKLPYFMPSLDKIYPDKGAQDFLDKSSGVIDVLDKLDGTSALLDKPVTDVKMFTRGNGSVGQDISKLISHIKHIGKMQRKEAVRGELMLDKAVFQQKYQAEFDNTRNTVNGVANTTKIVHKAAKDVEFIVHELVNPSLPWHKARIKLKEAGFKTVETKRFIKPTINDLVTYLKKRRKESKFDMDGLVLIDAKTNSRISFKVNDPYVDAEVKQVEWNLSKNGFWKPVVILKKAIPIGGVKVTRATAHNARRVVDWKIGPGAVVQIVRAGDVIPKVVGVTKKAKPSLPDNFKWDTNKVEAVGTNLSKKEKHIVGTKKLTETFRVFDIDGVRKNVAGILIKQNYDIVDLFAASEKEFKETGMGNANAAKLYEGLEKVRKTITHGRLMQASQIWPKGFTDTRFDKILHEVPYTKMVKMSKAKLIQIVESLHGFSSGTAETFVEHFHDYTVLIDELGWQPKDVKIKAGGKLEGMSFVFTKVRNKDLENEIKKYGGKVSGSINAKTTAVITKSKSASSPKMTKADDLKVPIYTLNEFKKQYGV